MEEGAGFALSIYFFLFLVRVIGNEEKKVKGRDRVAVNKIFQTSGVTFAYGDANTCFPRAG